MSKMLIFNIFKIFKILKYLKKWAESGPAYTHMHTHKRVKVIVAEMCPTLCNPMDHARQAALSMGFSRQEYWNGLSFPSPGGLPDPGIELGSPAL